MSVRRGSRLVRWMVRSLLLALVALAIALAAFRWQAARRERLLATDAAPVGGRFVRAADVDVFVQEQGDASAPAVLFVHGTGAWSETWRGTMGAVARAGFRAVALDLPPFGFSQRPSSARYGKQDQARRIVGVIEALGLDRPILVGHSFGGGPTVEAALLAPERARALVLVDAALSIASPDDPAAGPSPIVGGLLAVRPLRDAVVATFLTNPAFTRRLLLAFMANKVAATPERVAVYQRPLGLEGTTRAVGEWLPALLAPGARAASEDPDSYRRLEMPLLVIWGDRDTITPLSQGQHLASLAPGAELEVMSGVGHIPQIEAPEQFDAALLKLIARFRSAETSSRSPEQPSRAVVAR